MSKARYKVVPRFKESKTYISMGGMSMREIDLSTASQDDLKAIHESGAVDVVEIEEAAEPKGKAAKE